MADEDDLDAFFEEVQEVEAQAVEEQEEPESAQAVEEEGEVEQDEKEKSSQTAEEETQVPTAKRQKTGNLARPRGVVVASSTSVARPVDKKEENPEDGSMTQKPDTVSNITYGKRQQPSASVGPAAGPHVGPSVEQAVVGPAPIGPAFPGSATNTNNNPSQQSENKAKPVVRMAAGKMWKDESLAEWPENDYRIFVGNLTNDVDDAQLYHHFSKYPSLAKAKVVRHNNNPEKSKGYGFVSLLDPLECAKAIREMDQTWLTSRPIRVKRSDWKERDFKEVKKKKRKEKKQQQRMGL